jgi:tetratricopeptide (TPR) repeat protein
MGSSTAKVRLQLFGPPKIIKSTGEDCTPRGRKACALLAMLALSPENKRSRVWIQDKLWGSRGKEQGAASLRQSLSEIRKAFGNNHGLLFADSYVLALDPALFETDIDLASDADDCSEFLEGLDIGEDGFEDWLRSQRQNIGDRRATRAARFEHPADVALKEPERRRSTSPNRVVLVRGSRSGQSDASVLADSLIDSIAKTMNELGAAEVIDCRGTTDPVCVDEDAASRKTLSLHSDVFGSDTRQIVRVALLQRPENTLTWSSTLQLPGPQALDLNDADVMRCINLVVNVAIDQFIRLRSQGPDAEVASNLCYSGILHLFRLGKINFATADKLFAAAFDIESRGIYLAWRAYLRTFLLAERQFSCRQTLQAEALDFMHRALELEPHNSYVAGLSAHVQAMMRRSYVAAYELAERSIQLNHANPIGWACLGIAKSYLGKSEEGFHHTLFARAIAGTAPFRYQMDALSCIAGTMAGELEKAVHLAEASHALAPTFAPPLRYLSALYAHEGKHDLSFEMVRKLQASEPDFSYDKLRDKAYPAAGLHRTSIIDSLPARQI